MPAPALSDLVDPRRTAIVTQECQPAVVGPNAGLPELAAEARREAIPNIGRLLTAGRAAGVPVVHCLVQRHRDGLGANSNARLFGGVSGVSNAIAPGSPGASLIPEFGPADSDLIISRWHGLGPMGGTELDAVLRNMRVTTVVGVGVSVNVAITNFVMDAVNASYQFVLPRDAVAGVPREYADAVIDNTLKLLATVTTTDAIIDAWAS
ncbi:MAG TPA: isochorismatase family protein [Frankiaceae bacterium]|jgi:nicotinamidase-related amidase|nr:isochorismatase family protein [Frankiaceae bacterium]